MMLEDRWITFTVKMKFAFVILLAFCVVDVKPLAEVVNTIFKKYATLKILEDCYGKETVGVMLSEVGLAYAKCRGQPSFLHLLEQLISPADINPTTEQQEIVQNIEGEKEDISPLPTTPASTTTAETTVAPEDVSQLPSEVSEVPLDVISELPLDVKQLLANQIPVRSYPFGSGNRHVYGYNPYYYPQQSLPYSAYANQAFGLPSYMNGYRWKRAVTQQKPNAGKTVKSSAKPAVSFQNYLVNKVIAKHQYVISNMTCVLKEMDLIEEDLNPKYESISKRVNNLAVSDELKTDLIDGIETCRQYSSCVPPKTYGNIPAINELVKPYVFFKCFKGRKIEACMKKDLREKFGDLFAGIVANHSEKERADNEPESFEKLEIIFNMIYGLDVGESSGGLF